MIKQIAEARGKTERSFYIIKENCKWIFNKITLGLSPKSASQKIEATFNLISKSIKEKSAEEAVDLLKLGQAKHLPPMEIQQGQNEVSLPTSALSSKKITQRIR